METELATVASQGLCTIIWDLVQIESAENSQIQALINTITYGVPLSKDNLSQSF